jgi:hypothetical protein
MGYLTFLVVALALFIGFLGLTRIEARRGARYFAPVRIELDKRAKRVSFIAEHVDFPGFIRDTLRALAARIAHDIAHGSLIAVRFIERLLTRVVRALRERGHGAGRTPAAPTHFVSRMRSLKRELRDGRPEEPTSEEIE